MIVLVLVVFGLIFGSFVNALVWRLHAGTDWVRGRSECTHCHHVLAPKDLVPVFSWLWLRGKCRYCHRSIQDTPWPELVLPVLFVGSYLFWQQEMVGTGLFTFIVWCMLLVGFTALAVYDFKWFLLPDKIVFTLALLAVVQVSVLAVWRHDSAVIWAALQGVLVVSGVFYVLFELSKGTWIGFGDVKLGIVLGLLAGGLLPGFLILFFASVTALLATLPKLIQGKAARTTHVPFGPFLILGLVIVVLFGTPLINWYQGFLYV